jgi:hypothetical protein
MFYCKLSKPGVYFTFRAHLNLDWSQFKSSVAHGLMTSMLESADPDSDSGWLFVTWGHTGYC